MRVCLWLWSCICVHVSLCICVCISMCVCVCVCVSVYEDINVSRRLEAPCPLPDPNNALAAYLKKTFKYPENDQRQQVPVYAKWCKEIQECCYENTTTKDIFAAKTVSNESCKK
uniref:Uncharacterized protein n=1 Tax=Octopus bimaculoides TaxID=37653 RepID=A0A0L8IES5_OCTBM